MITKKMLPVIVACVQLLGGCDGSRPAIAVLRTPLFDDVAVSPKYSNEIAQADRNLSDDEWITDPFQINVSRGLRVVPIAREILSEIEPKLKGMSVAELVRCLKVQDGSGFITNSIADALYPEGNNKVISEIRSRPVAERELLLRWPHDGAYLDTGSQGESLTVDELVRELAPASSDPRREDRPATSSSQ
jgi:hypothetical protein